MEFQQVIDETVSQYLVNGDQPRLMSDIDYWCDDDREYLLVIVKMVVESIYRLGGYDLDTVKAVDFKLPQHDIDELWVHICKLEAARQSELFRQKREGSVRSVPVSIHMDLQDEHDVLEVEEEIDIVVTDQEDDDEDYLDGGFM